MELSPPLVLIPNDKTEQGQTEQGVTFEGFNLELNTKEKKKDRQRA